MAEQSPIHSIHEELGARFGEVAGRLLPRNYGDPAAEYRAVRNGAGVVDRWDRAWIRLTGRDPVKMIQGLVTNDLAGASEGQGVYAAMLTPKGKMLADLRAFRTAGGSVLMDVDAAALQGVLDHLKKYVPPLFARPEHLGAGYDLLGVYGPRSRELVNAVLGTEIPEGFAEEAFVLGAFDGQEVMAIRTEYPGEDGYDLLAPASVLEPLWRAVVAAGAVPVGHGTLEVLRIEAGRPRWGAELTEDVIPIEAGLRDRAISQTKGCYTGQEVIIRILHRGRVNWHLRGLTLGEAPAPAAGVELFRPGEAKSVGRVTSACNSPLYGQTIALGYVRREVLPPSTLRLGDPEGAEVGVVELPIPLTG